MGQRRTGRRAGFILHKEMREFLERIAIKDGGLLGRINFEHEIDFFALVERVDGAYGAGRWLLRSSSTKMVLDSESQSSYSWASP